MTQAVLGISAFFHDSAAALVCDGEIVAAAEEERFTRVKHDARFPRSAVRYCLEAGNVDIAHLDAIVFYEESGEKVDRLVRGAAAMAPRGLRSFLHAAPGWLEEKLFLDELIARELRHIAAPDAELPPLRAVAHHESHAASAFYPSPFETAAVLCIDAVGEWATTSGWRGDGATLTPLWELRYPHSLGLLYSAFTQLCGFRVNSDEYKLMGLSSYGNPTYEDAIRANLVDVKPDGSFRLNLDYLDPATELTMVNDRLAGLFGPARDLDAPVGQREMDLACSIQRVTNDVVLRLSRSLHEATGARDLCLAGGVALNCVANGRILSEGPYERLWVQPAAGDAGGAVGAALRAWYAGDGRKRVVDSRQDSMQGAYLGPASDDVEIEAALSRLGAISERLDEDTLIARTAEALANGKTVGWFQGRMEFGPRALGGRSILADPRRPDLQEELNSKVKLRDWFQPVAPAVLDARAAEYFELDCESPYMLLVAPVRTDGAGPTVPGVTHVDGTARIQTVHRETNPRFHRLIEAFDERTGCAVVANTSFNLKGEPIVCSAEDAYRCFLRARLDVLVAGSYFLEREAQDPFSVRFEKAGASA